jgi:hypothetical protein
MLLASRCQGDETNPRPDAAGRESGAAQSPTGTFDVGGYRLFLSCKGRGSPTVVFESGLNSSGRVWLPVQDRLTSTVRACWYDRAGVGMSEDRPEERVTSRLLADELASLLRTAGVPPPYVLVAHSIGGFTARLFAATYPDKVAGLVLVDTTASDWPTLREDLPEGNSLLDARASGAEVEAAHPVTAHPLAVVRHGRRVEGFSRHDERRFARAQARLARSSRNSVEVVALESGHLIPTRQPELVALIVRSAADAARVHALHLMCPPRVATFGGRCLFAP